MLVKEIINISVIMSFTNYIHVLKNFSTNIDFRGCIELKHIIIKNEEYSNIIQCIESIEIGYNDNYDIFCFDINLLKNMGAISIDGSNIIITIPMNKNIDIDLPYTMYHKLYLKLNVNPDFHTHIKNKMLNNNINLYSCVNFQKNTDYLCIDYSVQLFTKIEIINNRNKYIFDNKSKGIIVSKNDISNINHLSIRIPPRMLYDDLLQFGEFDDEVTINNIVNYEHISDNLIFIPFDKNYKFENLSFKMCDTNENNKIQLDIYIIKPSIVIYEVSMNIICYMNGMCGLCYKKN